VNERISVDELYRRSRGKRPLGRSSQCFRARHGKRRTDGFASGKQQVSHRGVKSGRGLVSGGKRRVESAFNERRALEQIGAYIH